MKFVNRQDAGRQLAKRLSTYANHSGAVVLALPRGGVPVGFEIASQLNLPLDVFVVRKLGFPGHEELAFGAIASGDSKVLNKSIAGEVPHEVMQEIIEKERQELARREILFRGTRSQLKLAGKTVILVDDGLATGATMLVAVQAIKELNTEAIIIAVPVCAFDTCPRFRQLVDDLICIHAPIDFDSVGRWYEDFSQTSDEEVMTLLNRPTQRTSNSA